MDDETRRLTRLLADGEVAGPEADEILARVFERLDRQKARPVRAIRYWAGAALAAAAAALLVFYPPVTPGGDEDPTIDVHFRTARPVLRVSCTPGTLSACPKSSTLVFSLSGQRASGFLSAYAEPIGREAERVWFFSKEDGSAELAAPKEGERASEREVPLPDALTPGRYHLHALLTNVPLGREEVVRSSQESGGGVHAKARIELVVTD